MRVITVKYLILRVCFCCSFNLQIAANQLMQLATTSVIYALKGLQDLSGLLSKLNCDYFFYIFFAENDIIHYAIH